MATRVKQVLNPILTRISSIDKNLLEDPILKDAPDTEPEFLKYILEHSLTCERCVLSNSRTQVVLPDGDVNASVLVVGEGPGFFEDRTQLPLVGPLELYASRCNKCLNVEKCFKHRFLDSPTSYSKKKDVIDCHPNLVSKLMLSGPRFVRSAGSIIDGIILNKWDTSFPRLNWIKYYNATHEIPSSASSPWFFTNSVMCRSFNPLTNADIPPEGLPRGKCKPWLVYQWAAVNPKICVAFGRKALASLLGNEVKANAVKEGEIIHTKFGPTIFGYHPAFYMRERVEACKSMGYGRTAKVLERALQESGLL